MIFVKVFSKKVVTLETMLEGIGSDVSCCGQESPKAVASWLPVYGSLATGRRKRRSPVLEQR